MTYVIPAGLKETVLEKILNQKISWLTQKKTEMPKSTFESQLSLSSRSFYDAFSKEQANFILECKKASPSKGLIRASFDIEKIANVYKKHAAAISVLTDEPFFQGDFTYLPLVSKIVTQPVLCKDFIIDSYQIYLARYYQADAILLMLSVLNDKEYAHLSEVAHSLNMGILTEVSNEDELARALALNAKVIGINNRDLRDLSVNLEMTKLLAPKIPKDRFIISESGIKAHHDIRTLSPLVDGFLIGSAIMAEDNLEFEVRKILLGENKVCGLTRPEDAYAAFNAGAIYGGLIFVENTPRHVSLIQAKQVMTGAPLNYVGVFRNDNIEHIISTVKELKLTAVQLHGVENQAYVDRLRSHLPSECQIWKALSIDRNLPDLNWTSVDKYVFDHGPGGSGKTFDWNLFEQNQDNYYPNVLLAGGISPDNCKEAVRLNCSGIDLNSGVESAPGIKSEEKIQQVFKMLREY